MLGMVQRRVGACLGDGSGMRWRRAASREESHVMLVWRRQRAETLRRSDIMSAGWKWAPWLADRRSSTSLSRILGVSVPSLLHKLSSTVRSSPVSAMAAAGFSRNSDSSWVRGRATRATPISKLWQAAGGFLTSIPFEALVIICYNLGYDQLSKSLVFGNSVQQLAERVNECKER